MAIVRALVVLWLASLASAAAFRPRGSASYSNATSVAKSLALPIYTAPSRTPSRTQQPLYPIHASGTGITSDYGRPRPTGQGASSPSASKNGTKDSNSTASCTVNIPSANLEWWYAATYDWPVGTLTGSAPNFTMNGYLTMIPNTDTFDASSAISEDVAYTPKETYDAEWDFSYTIFEEYTVMPTAAATSIVTQNAAAPLPSGNIIPSTDSLSYMLYSNLLAPTVVVASAANSTSAMTSATPFLYFTAYEVESAVNGSTITETVNLHQASAYEYHVKGIESSAMATGTVPAEFLEQIPQSACSPGTVQGTVTVLVVVNLYYFYLPHANPFIVHFESTALGFEDPTSDAVVVAQETSKGQPFTMNWDPEPTQAGGIKTSAGNQPADQPAAPSTSSGGRNAGSNVPDVPQPTDQTVGSIGTNPVVVGPSTRVIVGTQTLTPGRPAVTIGGSSISLAPSGTAIVVGGMTSALPLVADPAAPSQTVGTIGGNPVVIGPSSVVVVGTQTLQPGGPVVTVGGQPVSLAPSGTAIIIGSETSVLPTVILPGQPAQTQNPAPPILTIGSSTLTGNAATQFFIAPGQTLTPGGTATVDGTVVSLAPSASFLVVEGSTQILPTAPPSQGLTVRPEIVVGGTTLTALPGQDPNHPNANDPSNPFSPSNPTFVISGQTLVPGQAITVDGTTISLAPSASFVVINGVTSTVANPAAQITSPPLTIGDNVFTASPGSGTTYIIGSSTLTPGGVITVDGTTISLAPGATALIVNGQTTTLHPDNYATITNPPVLTIGSHTYTAAPGTGTTFIIGGRTLTPGGTITVDGTTISLAPGATELIYGSSGRTTSTALFPATTTRGHPITSSAPASAGATGRNGEVVATSSAQGAGPAVQPPGRRSFIISMIAGVLSLLAQ